MKAFEGNIGNIYLLIIVKSIHPLNSYCFLTVSTDVNTTKQNSKIAVLVVIATSSIKNRGCCLKNIKKTSYTKNCIFHLRDYFASEHVQLKIQIEVFERFLFYVHYFYKAAYNSIIWSIFQKTTRLNLDIAKILCINFVRQLASRKN